MDRSKYPVSVVPYPINRATTDRPIKVVDESDEWDAKWLRPKISVMPVSVAPPKLSVRPAEEEEVEAAPDEEPLGMGLRFLRWLFPEVNQRRAKRFPTPGLVAYYWTGGAPHSYHVGDMSATGLFLLTKERWAPGTLIQMTLQPQDGRTVSPESSLCVLSEVVRWGENGSGFNFILADYENVEAYGMLPGSAMNRKSIERFMNRLGVPRS